MMSRHKFEDYPELAEEMRNYASFNQFSSWQKFTDVLNNSLSEAEKKHVTELTVALESVYNDLLQCEDWGDDLKVSTIQKVIEALGKVCEL